MKLTWVMRATGAALILILNCAVVFAADSLPALRGVSLVDIKDPVFRHIFSYVRAQKDLRLRKTISISLQSLDAEARVAVVDVFGRDKAFAAVFKGEREGLGFMRAEVQYDADFRVTGHKVVLQRDFVELKPQVTVSLGDLLAVIEDEETGFRRSFPIGAGAIDDVHFKGVTTVMTPTTELSVLDKDNLFRRRWQPRYYRGKPFIPLMVPRSYPENGKSVRYRMSEIAFHVWQGSGFERGYLSHGCMRLRDEDLDELLAIVLGARGTVPVRVSTARIKGAGHPYPRLDDHYGAVKNFGTAENPIARKVKDGEGVYLTKLIAVKGTPPPAERLTGVSLDPVPVGPVPGPLMELERRWADD